MYSARQGHGTRNEKTELPMQTSGLQLSFLLTIKRIMTVRLLQRKQAILTEHLDFLAKEMSARIRSDYPANIWKEQKNDCITKMTQSRVKMSGKCKQDLDFAAEAKKSTF